MVPQTLLVLIPKHGWVWPKEQQQKQQQNKTYFNLVKENQNPYHGLSGPLQPSIPFPLKLLVPSPC